VSWSRRRSSSLTPVSNDHSRRAATWAGVTKSSGFDYWPDVVGAVTELFEGVLDVEGVRYSWRASVCTDLDGARFVADVAEVRPQEWRATLRVVQ
jgi:hypothetical protein